MLRSIVFIAILMTSIFAQNFSIDKIKKEIKAINTQDLIKLLDEKPNTVVLDVRIKEDIVKQGGYIKANKYTNISRDKLEYLVENEISKDKKVVVYCFNGNISLLATKRLNDMGYKNAIWYQDSYKGWSEAKQTISSLDYDTNSILYNKVKEVSKDVYTSIGATQPSTYENSGHNNNFGFIIGDKSVLVWNAGANYLLAKNFHEEIKKITNKPVKYVVLENSQGHAMLGSSYWKEQNAQIISHELAKDEIEKKGEKIYQRQKQVLKDKMIGTKVVIPDITFQDTYKIDLGNKTVELKYFGYAHEYSDIAIWLPKEKILFAGDLAFHQRMLPIFEITDTALWLEAWDKLEELNAQIVIPGHGDVTNMTEVRKYTKGYLEFLRTKVEEVLDNDGTLEDAYKIDQSEYAHLDTFKQLALRNVARVFKKMEFE